MAEGRTKDEWSRTASLMAWIGNCHRDPKKTRPFRPSDFDPFAKAAKPIKVGVDVVKEMFVHGKVPPVCRQQGESGKQS